MKHDYDTSDYKQDYEDEPKMLETGNGNFSENQNSTNSTHLSLNSTIFDKTGKSTGAELSG